MSHTVNVEPSVDKRLGAEFWDRNPCGGRWTDYSALLTWVQRVEPYVYEVLERHDWRGKRVVEVGCGQGTTANYLPQRGATVVALDMSIESLKQARRGADELDQSSCIRFTRSDAERLPFADHSFDAALSIGVLHHTADTAGGIREIHRVLKPGGLAIVMLYRRGTPKWWATWWARSFANVSRRIRRRNPELYRPLEAGSAPGEAGTALLELFGVPILKAFSNAETRRMFTSFERVQISNHQPGFRRTIDVLPALRPLEPVLAAIDRRMLSRWGFYQVVEARKAASPVELAPAESCT